MKLSDWFRANRLSLNISKTHYIIFYNGNSNKLQNLPFSIKIDGFVIERVTSTKFLHVIIDEKLSWKPHINSFVNKLTRNIGVMRRISYKLSSKIMLMLYDSLIIPHINYCVSVWGGTSRTNLIKIHTIQKKNSALNFISKTANSLETLILPITSS